jgi:hypothetical protein
LYSNVGAWSLPISTSFITWFPSALIALASTSVVFYQFPCYLKHEINKTGDVLVNSQILQLFLYSIVGAWSIYLSAGFMDGLPSALTAIASALVFFCYSVPLLFKT